MHATRGMKSRRTLLLASLLLPAAACAADKTPSAWCDALLPVAAVAEAVAPVPADGLERRATGVIAEDERNCNRIYSIGRDIFSDGLILLVSPTRSPEAARRSIEWMASQADGQNHFGLSRPEGLGSAAVHYRHRHGSLQDAHGMTFLVAFAQGSRVVELKYQNIDDGKRNKFVQASSDVVEIARGVAARMTP